MSGATPAPPPLSPEDFNASRGAAANITAWVSTGIGIAIVFLKLFTRTRITKITGWDDIFIFVSLVGTIREACHVLGTHLMPRFAGVQHHCSVICLLFSLTWIGKTYTGGSAAVWHRSIG
jgi:hypothetical protein